MGVAEDHSAFRSEPVIANMIDEHLNVLSEAGLNGQKQRKEQQRI